MKKGDEQCEKWQNTIKKTLKCLDISSNQSMNFKIEL